MPNFINERLLDEMSYGLNIGPYFDVYIEKLSSGVEARNLNDDNVIWKGSAAYNVIGPDNYELLRNAFMAAHAMTYSFRVKNWVDYKIENQSLGVAPSGSTPVQLFKRYSTFGPTPYDMTITKPISTGFELAQNGVSKPCTVDELTGLITPTTPWTPGADLTVVYAEFDLPMRFDMEWMPFTYSEWRILDGSVKVIQDLFA